MTRRAVVTGGEGGIGRAIVARLVAAGYHVVSADVAVAIGGPDPARPNVTRQPLDVTSPQSVSTAATAIGAIGPINALVNCAGILRTFAPDRFDDATARHLFDVNILGPARVISGFLPHLVDGGAIVNISSIAPRLNDQPATALYAATKAGLEAYTRHTAHGLGSRKIRVTGVAPGIIDVDMTEAMRRVAYAEGSPLERCPAGRLGTADEIAECVEFLLSDRASYINGTTLIADGGIVGW